MVRGKAPLSDLTLEVVDTSLALSAEQRQIMTPTIEALRAKGLTLTNDPIYRLESWDTNSGFHLRVSLGTYFENILVKQNPTWGLRSQAIAVVGVTECDDGYLLERRSEKVAALPGYLHPSPSGNIEPPATPLETFHNESEEELGLQRNELRDIFCLGMVYGENSGIYQLVARATTSTTLQTLLSRMCSGQWERSALLTIPKTADGLSQWLKTQKAPLTEGGRAAILLEGANQWGDTWLEEHLE